MMLWDHGHPYIQSTPVLCDISIIYRTPQIVILWDNPILSVMITAIFQYEYHYETHKNHNCSVSSLIYNHLPFKRDHSGLPSVRINLSPFTKDFRGGGHTMSVD